MFSNPANATSLIDASDPPANMMSSSPNWIALYASPIACALDAHAVTIDIDSPLNPCSIAIVPAAMFEIPIGINSGDILEFPFSK